MATVTPTVTVTPNAGFQIPQPQFGGNLGAVVLENISTYLLLVQINADTYYQAPLTSQVYPINGQGGGVAITTIAQAGDASTSGTVAPTWYSTGEQVPGTYPAALAGPAAVAAATAAATATQIATAINTAGVPNVLVANTIVKGLALGPGQQSQYFTYQYASLNINWYATAKGILLLQWYDTTGTIIVGEDTLTVMDTVPLLVQVPVRGAIVKFTGLISAINITAIGTNRTTDRVRIIGQTASKNFQVTTPLAAGATAQMINGDTQQGFDTGNAIRMDRACWIDLQTSVSAASVNIGLFIETIANNGGTEFLNQQAVAASGAGTKTPNGLYTTIATGTYILPAGSVLLGIINNTTTAIANALYVAQVTQAVS